MRTKIFLLILVCGFLLTSCVDDPDGPAPDFEVKFDVEFRGPNNPESASSDNPIEIFESESVTFTNRSIDTTGGISKPIQISSVLWNFEGGDPESSANHHQIVVYPNAGKYKVSLEITDIAGNIAFEEWNDYVTVSRLEPKPEEEEPEPEEICLTINEEVDDGRITNFLYDENFILIRADKFLNSTLQEYSIYAYDESERLEIQAFYNALDELLGTNTYTYNDDDQIIQERRENSDGSLVAEFVFSWSADRYVSNATLTTPDGLGGTSTTDIAYSYDDGNSNVTQEVFSVNGTTVGRIEYQFDSNLKVFSGLNIQAFPDRYNTNNQTSKIAYDQIGNLVYTISSTYQYDFESENCGKPISEMRTENGSSNTINYDYLLTY